MSNCDWFLLQFLQMSQALTMVPEVKRMRHQRRTLRISHPATKMTTQTMRSCLRTQINLQRWTTWPATTDRGSFWAGKCLKWAWSFPTLHNGWRHQAIVSLKQTWKPSGNLEQPWIQRPEGWEEKICMNSTETHQPLKSTVTCLWGARVAKAKRRRRKIFWQRWQSWKLLTTNKSKENLPCSRRWKMLRWNIKVRNLHSNNIFSIECNHFRLFKCSNCTIFSTGPDDQWLLNSYAPCANERLITSGAPSFVDYQAKIDKEARSNKGKKNKTKQKKPGPSVDDLVEASSTTSVSLKFNKLIGKPQNLISEMYVFHSQSTASKKKLCILARELLCGRESYSPSIALLWNHWRGCMQRKVHSSMATSPESSVCLANSSLNISGQEIALLLSRTQGE